MSDDLTARREADALDLWRAEGKVPAGVCPHCGSVVSVVQRDERFRARCSHRGCGACGPQHTRLTSAVEAFCRPPAYVARHMAVHPSSLTDVVTALEAERDAAIQRAERAEAAVTRQAAVIEAARAQSAAWDLLWSDSDDDDDPHRIEWERATNRTEHAIRALDAGEVRCDGDHGEPACSDATCWQLDSEEVNRG